MLLETIKEEFVFHCQCRNLSPKTIKNYEKQIDYVIREITIKDEDYEMLKKYAKACRKYEKRKGFTIDKLMEQIFSIGIDAIRETRIVDEDGNEVDWKQMQ